MRNLDLRIYNLTTTQEIRLLKRLEKSRRLTDDQKKVVNFKRNEARKDSRHIHLALGFLRGLPYSAMEQPLRPKDQGHIATVGMTRSVPDWDWVEDYATENWEGSEQDFQQRFAEFLDGAQETEITEEFLR